MLLTVPPGPAWQGRTRFAAHMKTMTIPNRAPAGTPTGGRFTPDQHAESTGTILNPPTAVPGTADHLRALLAEDEAIVEVNEDGTLTSRTDLPPPQLLDADQLRPEDEDYWELIGSSAGGPNYHGAMHYDGQPMQSALAAEILDCRGYTFAKIRNPGNDEGESQAGYEDDRYVGAEPQLRHPEQCWCGKHQHR